MDHWFWEAWEILLPKAIFLHLEEKTECSAICELKSQQTVQKTVVQKEDTWAPEQQLKLL